MAVRSRNRSRYGGVSGGLTGTPAPAGQYYTNDAQTNAYYTDDAKTQKYGTIGGLNPVYLNGSEAIVAKGGLIPSLQSANSTYTRIERRSRVQLGGQNIKSIRLVYVNKYLGAGEVNGSNPITVECAIEKIDGTAMAVKGTFLGNSTITIQPGDLAYSDPIYAYQFGLSTFPASLIMFAQTGIILSSTTSTWPCNFGSNADYESGSQSIYSTSAVSQIGTVGRFNNNGGIAAVQAYGPAAIIGEWQSTPDVSLYEDGNSIVHFNNDVVDNGSGVGGGFMVRGTHRIKGRTVAQSKVARSGEKAADWNDASNQFRKWLMQFATDYSGDLGVNDVGAGTLTAAQIYAYHQQIWTYFRSVAKGAKRVMTTIVSTETTSTDSWATTANQTPLTRFLSGGVRDNLNSLIVSNAGTPAGADFIINPTLDWMDSANPSVFAATGTANATTTDGIHPTALLHAQAAQNRVVPYMNSIVSTPVAKTPDQIPGLVLWLDASDATSIISSAGLVSQWNDKSGNNNNFTATGTARPTTGARSVNGLNGIKFNGTSNYMLGAAGLYSLPAAENTIVVIGVNDTSAFQMVYSTNGTGTYRLTSTGTLSTASQVSSGTAVTSSAADTVSPTPKMRYLKWFGVSGNTRNLESGVDGLENEDGTATGFTATTISIGAVTNSTGGGAFTFANGVFLEIYAYNRGITPLELYQLRLGSMPKWGTQ